MDRKEMKEELQRQMNELLAAAADLGFCFAFETLSQNYIQYCRNDVITIWSDELDFGVDVYDNKGNE